MVDKKVDYFTTGGGRPYEAHPYQSPDKNDKGRNTPVPIELDGLNQMGRGPHNFMPQKGLTAPGDGGEYPTQKYSDNK